MRYFILCLAFECRYKRYQHGEHTIDSIAQTISLFYISKSMSNLDLRINFGK